MTSRHASACRSVIIRALGFTLLGLYAGACELGDSADPGAARGLTFICEPTNTSLNDCGPTAQTRALSWKAPGDDGATGRAFQYDIRWAPHAISDENFDSQEEFIDEPIPQPSGTREYLFVPRVEIDRPVWFALRAIDEVSRESPVSVVGPVRVPFLEVQFLPEENVAPTGEFGAAIATGNWNDDIGQDIAIGAPSAINTHPASPNNGLATGAVYIYLDRRRPDFMRGTGITEFGEGLPRTKGPQTPDIVIYGEAAGDRFGAAVTSHRDIDDDNRRDLLIGAPQAGGGAGAVYLFLGNGPNNDSNGSLNFEATGTPGFPIVYDLAVSPANVVFTGPPGGALGTAVAQTGNMNDRKRREVALGAPGADTVYVFYGGQDATNALAALGAPPSGVVDLSVADSADVTILGPGGGALGTAMTRVLDLNGGDGPELALGAPNADAVYVFFGGAATAGNNQAIDWPQTGRLTFDISAALPDVTIIGGGASGTFGAALEDGGGVFGESSALVIGDAGLDRVVAFLEENIGAAIDFTETPASAAARPVYVIGTDGPADATLLGQPGEGFGSALEAGANVNGRNGPDLLIGAPFAIDPDTAVMGGAAVIFYAGNFHDALPLTRDRTVPGDADDFFVLQHQTAGALYGSSLHSYGNILFDEPVVRRDFEDFLSGAPGAPATFMEF